MTDREELRKLNADIAKIRGYRLYHEYTNDIRDAIDLIEESTIGYRIDKYAKEPRMYRCMMWLEYNAEPISEWGDTVSEAICRAYLMWKKYEVEK